MDIDQDDLAHARLWDLDEQARDLAAQAVASLKHQVALEEASWKRRRALDVGCGTGLLTAALAPFVRQVIAVDVSSAMIAVLRDKRIANVEVHCADLDDEAAWLGGFDLIVASCVCATLPSYPGTLRRLAEALSAGGLFVQWDWLRAEGDDVDDALTLREVTAAFEAAGLGCVYVDHAFDALFDDEPLLMGVGQKKVGSTAVR